jgi:long-chain acyl-CoA synthetase
MKKLTGELLNLAKRKSDSPVLESQGCIVTAAQLIERVERVRVYLSQNGISRVGLLADNSVDWVVFDIACQAEGICLVPIPTFFSHRQIDYLLRSASVEYLVYDQKNQSGAQRFSPLSLAALPGADELRCLVLPGERKALIPARTNKITFTSGSTGEPKGVCLSFDQCQRVAESLANAVGFADGWRHMCVLPLSTLLENIAGVYMPLLGGGTSVVYAAENLGMAGSSGLDVDKFLASIEQLQPQTMILVPQLLDVLDGAIIAGWKPPGSLKFVAVGGGRVAPAIITRAFSGGLPVYEGYGLSECASVVSLNTPASNRPGTSGQVLPHVQISDQEGEIVIDGGTFLGYLNKPSSWGKTSVSTGDVGKIDEEGFVTIAGRRTNILISSFGRNISPEWVESELLSLRFFEQVVVVGDGRPCCAALLLPARVESSDAQIQGALDQVNKGLPDYARAKFWLRLDERLGTDNGMLTDNGRLKRIQIQEHYGKQIEALYSVTEEYQAL